MTARPACPLATRLPLVAVAFACAALCGCKAPTPSHPVDTREEAITVAKAALEGLPLADGPFVVTQTSTTWRVEAPSHPGDAGKSSATVTIDAKTGRVTTYTDEVLDVAIIKPVK